MKCWPPNSPLEIVPDISKIYPWLSQMMRTTHLTVQIQLPKGICTKDIINSFFSNFEKHTCRVCVQNRENGNKNVYCEYTIALIKGPWELIFFLKPPSCHSEKIFSTTLFSNIEKNTCRKKFQMCEIQRQIIMPIGN